ncbi:mediator complex subunit MED14-domain-containing protein [Cristinia sonorae]|uniref:Mediator of RNA polymerase II transcription subunit 14 n=1 Tax=Cristinia sonorae TaxID=1940300 RepID=A0A8K0XUW2_9AGAR|nr:mediator complex subunit MED14-domain-containing protein [Cristinia sonorae]
MDHIPNGDIVNGALNGNGIITAQKLPDGEKHPYTNGFHEPSLDELERQLPVVYDGQVPLGELVSRIAQAIYAELTELAETMPNMSDIQRKRVLAEWVVKTKKQVVKLYAVVRWSRDADVVQKAMNVTAFLMDQNQQFVDAMNGLIYAKESLDPARLRNHDLLTSLDVLTTGSYLRLPTAIKKLVIPQDPLTDDEVATTLRKMEDVIRYRLRMSEMVPLEMSRYRIADGRAFFTASELFTASLCLRGAKADDGWFFVDVEFLFNVGGDPTGMEDFPRKPSGILKQHIADEADARLAFYLPSPPEQNLPPGVEIPHRPQLPEGVVDTPLVRLFNFLQMMSLSYQLEILWYQAERMRSLGWAEYLNVEMTNSRRTLTISYWIRKPPPKIPGKPLPPPQRNKPPSLGGKLIISIVPSTTPVAVHSTRSTAHPPIRNPRNLVLAELQERAKLGEQARPSDAVESMQLEVKWEPERGALGVLIPQEATQVSPGELKIDPNDLDVEKLLQRVIRRHTEAVLVMFQLQLQQGPHRNTFSYPGAVTLLLDGSSPALQTHLCADEVVIVTIDPRTGRLGLRDSGDLAAAGKGPRFTLFSDKLNDNPAALAEALVRLRLNAITDMAEQRANYLGLQCHRFRNFSREELAKLGSAARGMLYIQLATSPNHYLVIVITDEQFRFALILTKALGETMYTNLVMEDIAWIDVDRIQGDHVGFPQRQPVGMESTVGPTRNSGGGSGSPSSFRLESQVLRKLYAYCCARIAYASVERQLKNHGIPFTRVDPSARSVLPPGLDHLQSSLMRSIPALCVQSSDILSGAPAAEAAMPNIKVIPLNWWSESQPQVVTCVKLKYVQQPVGKRAGTSAIIRPSKRIIYDTTEAVVTFLSEDIDKCVDEFLEGWARVSKMVVIAREVGQMAADKHLAEVRLLSFDLQTVEFAYASDYSVSITCTDQLSPTGGSYELKFSRPRSDISGTRSPDEENSRYNPHAEVEPFLRNVLRHGRLAPSLHRLVALLRETLPIVLELQAIQKRASEAGEPVDTFAKAAGWFRVLYGDMRHALDFRLLTNARVVAMDASHSLFQADDPPPRGSTHFIDPRFSTVIRDNMDVLQRIPNFNTIVQEVIKEVGSQRHRMVFSVDIGIICDTSAVRAVGSALFDRVARELKQGNATAKPTS